MIPTTAIAITIRLFFPFFFFFLIDLLYTASSSATNFR